MKVLVDTNVLARMAQPAHPMHAAALAATERLALDGHRLCVAVQNLYELYVVATRPALQNGFGFTSEQALAELTRIENIFELIPESAAVYHVWRMLVQQSSVLGKTAHDARLVATMIADKIDGVLTFNASDFVRYKAISVLEPDQVVNRT